MSERKNQDAIDLLQMKVKEVTDNNQICRNIEKFELKDIKISDQMTYGSKMLSDDAMKSVLDVLEVKPAFKEFQKSMSEKDWELVSDKIKKAKGETFLYGNVTDQGIVADIFTMDPNKKKPDDMTNSLAVIDMIQYELANSECDYSLSGFKFDPEKNLFDVELTNESHPVDLLGNDPWKTGNRFIFNSLSFQSAPHFIRQICTNGMHKKEFGFHSDISKKSFNNNKIEKIIGNALHSINETHYQLLEEYSSRLRNNNISLDEFYGHKLWFNKGERKESEYDMMMEKYFDEAPFYKTYGLPVNEQPKTWLRTADSGINAYDFVNLLTWIASHPETSGLSEKDSLGLKIMAGNLFFKENLDLVNLAPRKTPEYKRFEYPILAEMK